MICDGGDDQAKHYNLNFSSFRFPIPLCPLSEHILLYLPRARLWQLRHHLHLSRHHELRDFAVLLGPSDYFLAKRRAIASVLGSDKRFRSLTPVRIRNCNDADFENIWVRGEHVF